MKNRYDVVIIGAGIGGLVCGCYLAKAGLRTLILEQHSIPGGYCTSFDRKGFTFDVGVHYLGSLRENGVLHRILDDLNVLGKIRMLENDPVDKIIMPGEVAYIRKNIPDTVKELSSVFPDEKDNIKAFVKFIMKTPITSLYLKTRDLSFAALLNDYFSDFRLKAMLSVFLGNIGVPPSRASAFVTSIIFKEYIFDGGYYPAGGMQVLPDSLADQFVTFGGELRLCTRVSDVITENKKVIGVVTDGGEHIAASNVVSNIDATITVTELLDTLSREKNKVLTLKESPSAFAVYLGLKKKLHLNPRHFVTWYFNSYDIEKCYNSPAFGETTDLDYLICSFPSLIDTTICPTNKDSVKILVGAKYLDRESWCRAKEICYKTIMRKLDCVFPEISDAIEVAEIATPYTFYRYTSNKSGALFGWEASISQFEKRLFPSKTSIKNLYFVGHWTTNGVGQSGIPVVAFSGKSVAVDICNQKIK
jgi:prolycopene isomerase